MAKTMDKGNIQSPSLIPMHEKGSRNKRKFRADPPFGDPSKLSPSLMECSNFQFPIENVQSNSVFRRDVCDFCNLKQEQMDGGQPDIVPSCSQRAFDLQSEKIEDVGVKLLYCADWNDLTEAQLEELILLNLDTIFKSAVKRIAACGYSEEIATKAVLRSGFYYGCKDTITNIVDNTLKFLVNGKDIDVSRDHFFEDLPQLVRYILAEMVCVIREVRPFVSIGDAMWMLLICDMNVSVACAMNIDGSLVNDEPESITASLASSKFDMNASTASIPELLIPKHTLSSSSSHSQSLPSDSSKVSVISNLPPVKFSVSNTVSKSRKEGNHEGISPEGDGPSSSLKHNEESPVSLEECLQTMSHASVSPEGKAMVSKRSHVNSSKRESILKLKAAHLDKTYRAHGAKGTLKTGKHSALNGLVLDKKCKSTSDLPLATSKIIPSMIHRNLELDEGQDGEDPNQSAEVAEALVDLDVKQKMVNNTSSITNTELSLSLHSKYTGPDTGNNSEPNCSDHFPSPEKSYKKWVPVPHDKKEEMLLKIVPRVRELQTQLDQWTKWAQQKVAQATQRLSKDKAELKALKQEKEEVARLKKEKQILEENTMKKLAEMENSLCKASTQVELANAAVRRLEVENSELRQEMEAASLQALKSAASCEEVSRREKKTMTKIQAWEKQKVLLQEELTTERTKTLHLQNQLNRAKDLLNQVEDKFRKEEKMKQQALIEFSALRKEREQLDASAKSAEDMIRSKAEADAQRYKDEVRKLEREIVQLRLKCDSSKVAALSWGVNGSYASRLLDGKNALNIKQIDACSTFDTFFREFGMDDVQREQECVMCLNEIMSVVFLPCAHQVVCTKCNERHEKQGMKDCPSCRTPIHSRICVRSANS